MYFLCAAFGNNLTGIEHASLKRFSILSKSIMINIVTLNFSNLYNNLLGKHGIEPNCFLNFYNYYSCFLVDKPYLITDLLSEVSSARALSVNVFNFKIFSEEKYVMYAHCFPNSKRISFVNYFNAKKVIIRREIFDYFGYLSSESIFSSSKVVQQNFFNNNGDVFLRINHNDDQKFFTLLDNGIKYFFDQESDMHAYWLKKILKDDDILFIDKNRIYNPILSKLQDVKLKKIAIIHSTHTSNPNIQNQNKVNSNYKFLLENQSQFTACVVATQSQYLDLKNDFDMQIPVYVIPPSYISESRVNHELSIDPFRILSIGRIAVEKRQEDMIMAMKIVVKQIPNAKLEIFGTGTSELTEKLKKMVLTENLSEHVFFRGYSQNIAEELFNAHLSLVTSKVESFCIAILDSMEQGTPVISYDIKYGPEAIIENAVNGRLVENGNIQELAKSIIDFYQNHIDEYSLNCQLVLKEYSKENVLKKWMKLLEDIA